MQATDSDLPVLIVMTIPGYGGRPYCLQLLVAKFYFVFVWQPISRSDHKIRFLSRPLVEEDF